MRVVSESVRSVADAQEQPAGRLSEDRGPFRILILGNFSGRDRSSGDWRANRPVQVDRDNIDAVLAGLRPKLTLETGSSEGPIRLEFREIDDFHPDRIYERVPLFRSLLESRGRLSLHEPDPPSGSPGEASILDMILAAKVESPKVADRPKSPLESFFHEVGSEHAIRGDDEGNDSLRQGIDGALSRLMSSILHDPDFQSLEAAWRGVDRLTRRLDTDSSLTVALLDVTIEELAADFDAADDLASSALYQLLVRPTIDTPGGQPWGVLVGNYRFEPTQADVVLLGYLGLIAQAAGAPFVSAGSSKILGTNSLKEQPEPRLWRRDPEDEGLAAFDALRGLPVAKWIGLALPRPLMRLPYSVADRPIESFEFEEFVAGCASHEDYLWGNPATLLAELLGRSFTEEGWSMEPGSQTEVMGLPLAVDRTGDEPESIPCAEVILGQKGVEAILDRGLMPLLSYPGRDVARVARFQSIADPAQPLAGRWR